MKISRRRKNKLELQLTYIAISNPSAEGEYRHKVVLETLPRNGVLTPEQLKNQTVSLTIVCNGEGSRVAEDIDIADSPLEDAEQIWGRHHRVWRQHRSSRVSQRLDSSGQLPGCQSASQ